MKEEQADFSARNKRRAPAECIACGTVTKSVCLCRKPVCPKKQCHQKHRHPEAKPFATLRACPEAVRS